MANPKEFYETIGDKMKKYQQEAPNLNTSFGGFFNKVMTDGAISLQQKELIALGIAVAVNCYPCIMAHVKKCLDAGATREQIIEAASVAVVMGGGPAFMHTIEVIEALEALGK